MQRSADNNIPFSWSTLQSTSSTLAPVLQNVYYFIEMNISNPKCVKLPLLKQDGTKADPLHAKNLQQKREPEKKQKEFHGKWISQCKYISRQRCSDIPEGMADPFRSIEFQWPCYRLLMETPSYIQVIDYSHRQPPIDTYWSTAVIAISLILQPIPQKVIGTEPEAAKHEQFQ